MHVTHAHIQKPAARRSPTRWRRSHASVLPEPQGTLHPIAQAKLRVGTPNDKFEREADRVADQVIRMAGPIVPQPAVATESVQRLCAECAGGSSLCAECAEEEESIRAKPKQGQTAGADPDLAVQLQAIRGSGQPLPTGERSYFEARFRRDFSGTRIHAGKVAADLATQANARAFTLKRDIFFGAGEYRHDQSSDFLHLLAHELAHVVQQGGANVKDESGTFAVIDPFENTHGTNLWALRRPSREPETMRRAPAPPARKSTYATLQPWLGGDSVPITYSPEDPRNSEAFPYMDLQQVFQNFDTLTSAAYAQRGAWIRYDLQVPALVALSQGAASLINPSQWTFWLRCGSSGYEAQADVGTRSILREIKLASRQGTPSQEGLLHQVETFVSETTARCRARYFYQVMTENGLSPSVVADYGNWCGKGGSGPVQDTFDQCCKEHDECYGRNNCSIFDVACWPQCNRCDDSAVQCWLRAVAADPARYGTLDNIRYPCADCDVSGMTPEKQTRCRAAGCIP
jgi:hypothetical protein